MQTKSEENYLKAIWKLAEEYGDAVSTNAIAAEVNTKAASVTDMLKKLAAQKLIGYIPYQGVRLTKSGKQAAAAIVRKHRLWEVFLVDKLGFGWDAVHDIAEQLEHIKSEELTERLDKFLGFPKNDPHGDPIPDKSGKLPGQQIIPLNHVPVGKTAQVSGVGDHSASFLQFLDKNKIRPGSSIRIHEITAYDHSMEISLDGKKKIHISKQVAQNILVKKTK
jgi:DtxR family Mn-dependent transcriptional regulator